MRNLRFPLVDGTLEIEEGAIPLENQNTTQEASGETTLTK